MLQDYFTLNNYKWVLIIIVSSVTHYCGFKEQEIPTMYTVWMEHLLKLKF